MTARLDMVTFSCRHCGAKLKIKNELAGKRIRCPHCKAPADLAEEVAVAPVPPSPLAASGVDDVTLAPAGVSPPGADATLPPPGPVSQRTSRDWSEIGPQPLASDEGGGERYQLKGEIARGGMGAVLRAVDRDIEREVAVKYLLNQADGRQKARFIEEAKITGQLEHPNIVPIHDLGLDGEGQLFFSMKMVKGRSLAQILEGVGQASGQSGKGSPSQARPEPGRPEAGASEYTLGRLLIIFGNICNALAYSHARGVIHRDLKPANIMIGDFGEVYVMDWGLAKVLARKAEPAASATGSATREAVKSKRTTDRRMAASAVPVANAPGSDSPGALDSSLTQDGAVLGTPAYMPPEQAKGDMAAVDQRSDIYSLGAILYEVLTLTPPVGRGGDAVAILMRVAEGRIDPPAKRAPNRWVPPELAAIAMKALAHDPALRYQTVEDLQRDLQLFQEGRSVSAKQDSAWEMFKKLVKRNKGVSAGVAIALLVLVGSLAFIARAWHETGTAYDAFKQEQQARRDALKKSVPAFLAAATFSIEQKQLDQALDQLAVVLEYEPDHAQALLRKAQVLIAQHRFEEARSWLAKYLEREPGNTDAGELAEWCTKASPKDAASAAAFGQIFNRQGQFALAEAMFQDRPKLLEYYRQRVDAREPGLGKLLQIDKNGHFVMRLSGGDRHTVKSVQALQGIPVNNLKLHTIPQLTELSALQGLPLVALELYLPELGDVSALRGLPLKEFIMAAQGVKDLSPLAGMKLEKVKLSKCDRIESYEVLAGMPITYLRIDQYCPPIRLQVLKGMPLKNLFIYPCKFVSSLSALEGMPLENLYLNAPAVDSLAPLRGLPLKYLQINSLLVKDVAPLEGMQLERLLLPSLRVEAIRGMEVLRKMDSLETISIHSTVSMSAQEFWRKYDAGEFKKKGV